MPLPARSLAAAAWLGFALLLSTGRALAAPAEPIETHRPHDVVLRGPAEGNPFEVDLWGVLRGPDGARRVRGFYDGDDRWVIRINATSPGAHGLRTISSLPALSGQVRRFIARPGRSQGPAGVLQIDPRSRRHFRWADGTRFFLMGYEADWLWGADMTDPARKVMHRLIEQMANNGFNYVLVNVYAHDTSWAPGRTGPWDYGPPALYPFGGTNEAPDHARLNPRFFQAYDEMMWALWSRGIVAHVMIKVYNKKVRWPAPGSPEERRFFQYVLARYQAFPNVVWDFSKEAKNEKDDELQHRIIKMIRSEDAYRHLVTLHDDITFFWNERLRPILDFETHQLHRDQVSMTFAHRARSRGPLLNAEFGYEYGVEKLPTHTHWDQCDWKELLRRAWVLTLAGTYPVYYYNNTAWDVVKPDPEPPGMSRWKILKDVLASVPYWQMEPHDELAHHAVCLASPGRAYVFYLTAQQAAVDLRAVTGTATATWIDTWTGARTSAGTMGRGVHLVRKPESMGEAPAALVVTAQP